MFTGIIEHLGVVRKNTRKELVLQASEISTKIKKGDSLAVNGVCLTLIKKEKDFLYFSLSQETIDKTNLGLLKPGSRVNLEMPLTLQTPLSGHLVTGHVDGKGKVIKVEKRGTGKRLFIYYPKDLRKYIIPKGSIAINGVSLTIASLSENHLEIELIPFTLEHTNLNLLKPGDIINIECDLIGKYLSQWFEQFAEKGRKK
ncbi:riboflavin synthase [SCandidatus Aminicenantes bacterium Aminicenantia_JdfR_composite]|jgi:riboflavin synthase|nr:riboflavin synthase [SCandidatus Aminicenantes bacterium Aminicenantia_JdfR_composite]MCP2597611.1 riboflavin synthase [Candidatus Aminicenantes bacterium AC-335-G13]MCP2598307.1 riboflavin synthase [Candidatus Aminicenantes bacterium AC-335-L06]MCP2620540.1 riboflavin synthase [Candidatus Aminicenantes bacterium AC-334-E05]